MKILIAGASGAIGQPLVDMVVQEGHEVYGITQSKERALIIAGKGARPLILNVLDREAIFSSIASLKPEVVIDMLTHLPKEYTPESMRAAAELDAKIRREGGANLQAAAEASGTSRYIVQSSGFCNWSQARLAAATVFKANKRYSGRLGLIKALIML